MTQPTFKKLVEFPLDKDTSYDVVSCDRDRVTVLDYGPYATGTPHRLVRWDLRGGKSETVVAGKELGLAIKAANDDGLAVEWQDHIRIIDAKKRTYFKLEPCDVTGIWSCDRDQQRVLIAGILGSPFNPRIFEYVDGSVTSITRPHQDQTPFAAFYIHGEVGHVTVDHTTANPIIGLYDNKDQLRSSVPISKSFAYSAVTYSVTTVGDVRYICAQPITVTGKESEVFDACLLMRCDGWALTKVD